MKIKHPRVRFAPSPTGSLHVGGARTALFNWLFAQHHDGTFVLRMEDTDLERSTKESEQEILECLKWLGLDWDEGPFYQSQRLELYQEKVEQLLKEGKAYYSEEEREGKRAILFKMPKESLILTDYLRGEVAFDNRLQKDLVIMKSDGMPTYHFACVVDDALMQITHVIRGDDHLSNTPKQIPLYHALGFPVPIYVHVPMILGSDGSRLSKRHGATSVAAYKEQGVLPEALVNFLALLGWSPGENLEILSLKELIKRFDLDRLLKKSALFDVKKFLWINESYLRAMPLEQFQKEGFAYLKEKSKELLEEKSCLEALALLQSRIQTFYDLLEGYSYFFQKTYPVDPAAVEKYLKSKEALSILPKITDFLQGVESFEVSVLEEEIRGLADQLGLKAGALIHPLRVAVTGQKVSPGIFETLAVIGKDEVMVRLRKGIESVA